LAEELDQNYRDVGRTLCALTRRFKAAGIDSARLDARILVAHALGVTAQTVFAYPERVLDTAEHARVEVLAGQREARRPMAQLIGHREFWSLDFRVTPDVLDPRPDSETLVQSVLERLPDRNVGVELLDFGTGSGCLLLALLSELPQARGTGIDVSPAALAVARDNAERLGLAERASFRSGDWGSGLDRRVDVIVSNPPYIPDDEIPTLAPEVALHEPRLALAGGTDGLDCYRAIAPHLVRLLNPGGLAALEVGWDQAEMVATILGEAGMVPEGFGTDLAGSRRCVLASGPQAAKA
jgi:release factor glutamine methyltransferase